MNLTVDITDELVEQIAQRVAEINGARPGDSPDRDGRWLRGAEAIASYVDCPPSRIYALVSAKRIPVQKDGSALVAHTDELDAWIRAGGGIRP